MPDTPRFDSLVHVTRDGHWLDTALDAGRARLYAELDSAGIGRACLAGRAGAADNAFVLECAKASPGRFVPIAGLNAAKSPTSRAAASKPSRWPAPGSRGSCWTPG